MVHRIVVTIAAVSALLLAAGSVSAHHAFGPMFDANSVLHIKGIVVRFDWVNPHTFIVIDVKDADGGNQRWALEGPAPNGLIRRGYSITSIKPGELVEACGYGTRDTTPKADAAGVPQRVMNVELLTLVDGESRVWQDYGQRKCRELQEGGR